MMVKKGSKPDASGRKKVPVKTDTAAMEEQTIERAGRTIKTLEDFLHKWDSAESRPDLMFPEVVRIRQFCDMLKAWRKGAMESRGSEDDEARMKRLRDFVVLCSSYS